MIRTRLLPGSCIVSSIARGKRWLPLLLGAAVIGVSAAAADAPREPLPVLDLTGQRVDPFATDARVTVFVFARSDCPISNRYAPELRRLHQKFANRGVEFWLVYPDPDESVETIRRHLKAYDYPWDALRDPEHALVRLSRARITPEAAVFVGPDDLAYRGRIDDLYVDFGKTRAAPSVRDLEQALEAVLAGRPVTHPVTRAVGCFISDLEELQDLK